MKDGRARARQRKENEGHSPLPRGRLSQRVTFLILGEIAQSIQSNLKIGHLPIWSMRINQPIEFLNLNLSIKRLIKF